MRLYQNYWMKEIEDAVQKLYVPRLQDPSGAAFDAELLHAPIIVNMAAEEDQVMVDQDKLPEGTRVVKVDFKISRKDDALAAKG
ncbi:unnamed protein product, partial [Symbiodinium microadriaticum]